MQAHSTYEEERGAAVERAELAEAEVLRLRRKLAEVSRSRLKRHSQGGCQNLRCQHSIQTMRGGV
jgi:hypothetical protein